MNDKDELARLYAKDEKRFRENFAPDDVNLANQPQLIAKLVFSSHSLEKSLSNDNFEVGHGMMVVRMLVERLQIYNSKGFDTSHLGYINTISVLRAFYDKHKGTKYQKQLEDDLADILPEVKKCQSKIGGADVIPISQKENNYTKNFRQLSEDRFAIRKYADKPVSKNDVKEAIEIALKTPSACNRQPVRVYEIYDKQIIARVLEVQGGIDAYETPPVLLLLTADDNNYVGINERNQGFIDGGLFAMSILYALEHEGLAACPLHAMFEEYRDKTIRGMLGIPGNEKLITFISVGHFTEENHVCKSFRYPVEYIAQEIKGINEVKDDETIGDIVSHEVPEQSVLTKIRRKLRPRTRLLELKRRTHIRTRVKNTLRRQKRRYFYDGAIVTLTGGFNYGNIIQRYALQHFLSENGFKYRSFNLDFDWDKKTHDHISRFVEKYIDTDYFDPVVAGAYKSYIVGSDQVWRDWWCDWQLFGRMWLNFVKSKKARRIAYAASFGNDTLEGARINNELADLIKPLIKQFDAISVREKSGIKFVKQLGGRTAVNVVDPTMLMTPDDYSRLINSSEFAHKKTEPIFCYILDRSDEKLDFAKKISQMRNQKISDFNPSSKSLPPVEQWLKGFRDAELVVTDSFHGIILSIINNTDFIAFGNEERGLARMVDLLAELGVDGRLIDKENISRFNYGKLEKISWERVNEKLDDLRDKSSKWLLDNIDKKEGHEKSAS